MQAESQLFYLPREVRDRIYEFYLAFENTDFEDVLRPRLVYLDVTYSRPLPPLMLTCKSLYQELSRPVHGHALMRVENHGWNDRRIGFAVRGVLRFDRLEKLWLLVATEHPNWNSWLSFFGEVIERARNLEVLVIDWAPRPENAVGWTKRVMEKKESEFHDTIATLQGLRLIQVYGNIPLSWKDRLEKTAHVTHYVFRWWREPGLDW
ncbi:hypothetical protein F4677DRAFT_439086 [Hypoxylon crocopeplum]|nr:hypothetical protein F4677DRAFT_439086 [Hypoxylon crocopeplum]